MTRVRMDKWLSAARFFKTRAHSLPAANWHSRKLAAQ